MIKIVSVKSESYKVADEIVKRRAAAEALKIERRRIRLAAKRLAA